MKKNMATSNLSRKLNRPKTVEISGISLEQFLVEYSDKEDGFRYEWNNGKVEKLEGNSQENAILLDKVMRAFIKTKAFQAGGMLAYGVDMKMSEKSLRRPSMAYFTNHQVAKFTEESTEIAPLVVEIISKTDTFGQVYNKLDEYFQAGVKVVWHILPNLNRVYVYTAPTKVKLVTGKTICSASPALEDFEIPAEAIFAK